MTSASRIALALAISAFATAASASDALVAKYACVACHQADRKAVGPSWIDIAAKYADGSKTREQLAESIRKGGAGKWGAVPMPPQSAVNEADAQALAQWVLSRKK